MSSLTCVHTLYNIININTWDRFKNAYYYMLTYPLQQQNHEPKCVLPELPVLFVYIP